MKNRATVFSENLTAIADGDFAIVPRPDPEPMPQSPKNPFPDYIERLGEYVESARLKNGQGYEDVAKLAQKRGGDIGKSTVQQIAKGQTPNPSIYTLVFLAWGLSRPVEELFAVALGDLKGESLSFKRSSFANLADLYEALPNGDQRIMRRYLQMVEREMRRILMQQGDDDQLRLAK